ncbi:ISL3 family transposase, partial [Vibrio harveyi]|uniref:ISL3 family transposase n=1 Tax=Vibrio harveyi TaxID=669 RepID=UPI003BB6E682
MASLKTLLQLPRGWHPTRQSASIHGLNVYLKASSKTARCPDCLKRSNSIHSHRERRLQHLPCVGQTLYLIFTIRHWYCHNRFCKRRTFAESLSPFAEPRQQSSIALQNLQRQFGLIAGGNAGKRAESSVGIKTSADTLLRRVVQAPETLQPKTPHVGIDEWAWQRGHTYGTLIVDLNTHRPLVLLPGREKRALTTWFKKYPEIQVVSRDRGGIYAVAAREGAPQARQVADRWHLLKNIGDALERMMHRHIPLIREVTNELAPKVTTQAMLHEASSTPSNAIRLKQQKREKRYQRWTQVNDLYKKGHGIREISRATGLSRVTVRRWIQSKTFPEISSKPPRPKLIDSWSDWLEKQLQSGYCNASQLWQEMVEAGFTGSVSTVRYEVTRLRKGKVYPVIVPTRIPSASRISRWLTPWRIIRGEESYASRFISRMCDKEPQLKLAQKLALEFYKILKTKNKRSLHRWFESVSDSGLIDLQRVAKGMEADLPAVNEAVISHWSNGVVEGHVNRLKMLKRQMYGR